jgi:hypothetical protein
MNESITNSKKINLVEPTMTIDPAWKGVYRVGGICMVMAWIFYLVGSTFGSVLGVPPDNSEAYFQSLANKPALATATYWIFLLTDLFLIPATLGLFHAIKGINKNAMLIAAGILGFFLVFDLGITELNSLALVTLTQNYSAAISDVQRAAYLGAAHWGLATMPIATFFSWIGPSSGFLITSILMRKGIFGSYTAWLGIIVNSLGIAGGFYFLYPVPALSLILTPILVLYGIWLIAAGRRLYKLG